ncbi:hypothetical protein Leryth_026895 [Lithospermum erythrorhizon]|nr:hypothetical protein Leryth_026895 [Lithospermum erythrorhizon]
MAALQASFPNYGLDSRRSPGMLPAVRRFVWLQCSLDPEFVRKIHTTTCTAGAGVWRLEASTSMPWINSGSYTEVSGVVVGSHFFTFV